MSNIEVIQDDNLDMFEETDVEATDEVVEDVEDVVEEEQASEEVEEDQAEEVEASEDDAEESEDDDEEELIVSFGDKEPEEDKKPAENWVKNVRQQYKEEKRLRRELEKKLAEFEATKQQQEAPKLPERPKLSDEGIDYDTDRYEEQLAQWIKQKEQFDLQQQEVNKKIQAQEELWQKKVNNYQTTKESLKVRDYDDAEEFISRSLTVEQQGMLLAGADNPALLVYALGKDPKLVEELANIQDPVEFNWKAAKMEAQLKVSRKTGRKAAVKPEKTLKGSGPISGSVDSNLERLRAEAERTGDYTKVIRYKKQKSKTG